MKVAERVRRMKESSTLAVAARAAALRREGADVVAFGTGEPDFDTPANIKEAAERALRAGMTKYVLTPGTPEARAAIAAKLRDENGIACRPEHVSITAGAKHALYLVLQTLVDPGDEVILPRPYYFNQEMAIRMVGCVPVFVDTTADFQLDVAALAAAVTPRTRAIVTVSPNNPTGAVYREADLRAVNALCRVNKVQDTNLICAPVISQLLALESLKLGRRAIEPELQSLASVRHKVHESLAALDGLASFPRTQGAFYVVLRLPGVSDPHAFIRAMVERHRVAVIPGFAFGLTDTREANYQRLSFGSLDPATVAEGVQRFIAAVRDWYGR